MGTNSTLLCIHRDPAQLGLLEQSGYELVTATTGSHGLRLFMSQAVDAIVLDYQLGLLDGGVVAGEIKKFKPQIPIVMLSEDVDLPIAAVKSVDALVSKSDGPYILLATVRHVLHVTSERCREGKIRASMHEKDAPFSQGVWNSIWDGTIQFAPTTKAPHAWSTRAVPIKTQT
jgi:DNA-binding response OmpR family regulator